MSRSEAFDVMDVSTSICDDPKFRRLARENPEHLAVGFMAYVATMAESWKAGRRMPIEDAWPVILPFDAAVCASLRRVALLDRRGQVSMNAWRGWFEPARERRSKSRDRWTRYNAQRDAVTALQPRGSDAVTALQPRLPSVPSVSQSVSQSVDREIPPPPAERGRRKTKTNPRATGSAPRDTATNPRSNGTSTRQVRADRKRGPTSLPDVLRRAAGIEPAPSTELPEAPDWALPKVSS